MAKTEVTREKLEVRRTFRAPPERIFHAWTDPKEVMQWFPPPGYEAAPTSIDLRKGGTYRWGLRKLPDGEPFFSTGKFLEVDAPKRLVYTFRWSTEAESAETIVTIDFQERSGGTEIVLRHDRFPTKEARNEHEQGWKRCLDQLAEFISKEKKR
jgi:uncharacterized protein YndB with AHSA1/START domain